MFITLYGGIFEWKNNDFQVYNSEEQKPKDSCIFKRME